MWRDFGEWIARVFLPGATALLAAFGGNAVSRMLQVAADRARQNRTSKEG